MPALTLVGLALAVEGASRVSRERLRQFGPRRYPVVWGIAGAGVVAGTVALIWLSVWLVRPLFDEGTNLNEGLAFTVEGVEQPTTVDTSLEPATNQDSAGASSDPAANPASTTSGPAEEASGALISRGELMGADEFHTGAARFCS